MPHPGDKVKEFVSVLLGRHRREAVEGDNSDHESNELHETVFDLHSCQLVKFVANNVFSLREPNPLCTRCGGKH